MVDCTRPAAIELHPDGSGPGLWPANMQNDCRKSFGARVLRIFVCIGGGDWHTL